MKTFASVINEASVPGKNTHLTHIEDLVIYGGVDGCRDAILALRSLRDMLAGESSMSTDVTQKWDGAPALFCGKDPGTGEFFVAKKGIFNKTPKVYKSVKEIYADTTGDLAKKLSIAFIELQKLPIKNVLQGDILFTKDDLKTVTIDGRKYVTFHPNTIVYAIPHPTADSIDVLNANLGIVFHTSYTGSSFETLKASYGVDVSKLQGNSSCWVQTANLKNLSGTVTFTERDTEKVTGLLSTAGQIFRKISSSTLKELQKEPELQRTIETFENSLVRANKDIVDSRKRATELVNWIHDKYAQESAKRSTEKGKASVEAKKNEILKFFSPANMTGLVNMFELRKVIVQAKQLIIDKLDKINSISTFIRTKNGYHTTGSEGFVAIDKLRGGAVKLVNRMQFSTNNFNPDVIKGWDR